MTQAVRHLTPAQLADRLQVAPETVREWRRLGKGPAYIRTERGATKTTIRYPLKDVEAWEESKLVQPRD